MAGEQQQQGGGPGGDQSNGPLWICIIIVIMIASIWVIWHDEIVTLIFKARLVEISLVLFCIEKATKLATWLQLNLPHEDFLAHAHQGLEAFQVTLNKSNNQLIKMREWIYNTPVSTVSFDWLRQISAGVGRYLAWPLAIVGIILAFVTYYSGPGRRFRELKSMASLRATEHNNWPQICPIMSLDLVNEDIDSGPWAMGMSPMQFAKKHDLLKIEPPLPGSRAPQTSVIRHKADKVFVIQLGPPWQGLNRLNIYSKALFAVFAARYNQDTEPAVALLRQISQSSMSGKLDFSGTEQLLKKHQDSKIVRKITQSHAYTATIMAAMLEASREDGVMASADFIWLKPLDRKLWYILNTIGRQTAMSEVGGVQAHFLAEQKLHHRLNVPHISAATDALEEAIAEILYIPDEEE